MELGEIQKKWVLSLRNNPERQISDHLGHKVDDERGYVACCLGEALCVLARHENEPLPFVGNTLFDGNDSSLLSTSFKKIGLINDMGGFTIEGWNEEIELFGSVWTSLSQMNDKGISWAIIADVIEEHADKLFTHSI